MKKLLFFTFVIALVVVSAQQDLAAQCAMCRASLENNVSNGDIGYAARLNVGIMYLFALPYLLIFTIGLLWYRRSQKNKTKKMRLAKIRDKVSRLSF